MKYDQLTNALQNALPLNRKERFYTGTVLPSILFHNGISNLYCFLRQITGFPEDVNEKTTKDNFLFYTEYNLKESAGSRSGGTQIFTTTRDTPDVIIHILDPMSVIIVIEAKMFVNISQSKFNRQMKAQKDAVIDVLKNTYQGCNIFHIGLVPKELGFITTTRYQIINWEFFIDNPELDLNGNYFSSYLKYALDNYHRLVSIAGGKATTIQDHKTGLAIYMDFQDNKAYWIGRNGGRSTIEEDVKLGTWRNKVYGTNFVKPVDGREGNWITSEEFSKIVENRTS